MALEWAGEEEKNVSGASAEGRDDWGSEYLRQLTELPPVKFTFDKDFVGGYYYWDEAGKVTSIFEQEYPTTPEEAASPTITFKHGDVEKSITLSESDLKPRLKFKLHQKVDALIKQAYNK